MMDLVVTHTIGWKNVEMLLFLRTSRTAFSSGATSGGVSGLAAGAVFSGIGFLLRAKRSPAYWSEAIPNDVRTRPAVVNNCLSARQPDRRTPSALPH
jgi:hypothetical protein